MGYYFNVRGCYRVPPGSCDLATAARTAFAERSEWSRSKPGSVYAVLGPDANHVVFATESNWDAYAYALFVRDLARATPAGSGLVLVNGECPGERDRVLPIYGGRVHDVPVEECYTGQWGPLTYAAHDLNYTRASEPAGLRELGAVDCSGGLRPPAAAWGVVDLEPVVERPALRAAADELAGDPAFGNAAVSTMSWFSEPRILFATDAIDGAAALDAVAGLTRRHVGSAGVLFWSDWSAGRFVPALIFDGRARPIDAVSLRRPDGSAYPEWGGREFTGLYAPPDDRRPAGSSS